MKLCIAAVLLLTTAAFAQVPSAIITGTVVDPSGAVVPQARVTATQLDTSWTITRESASDGTFRLAGLEPGNYRLEVKLAGFNPYIQRVRLEVRQAVEIKAQLSLSGADYIEVTGAPTPVTSM